MRHFAFHTLQRLIPFAAPEVAGADLEQDNFWLERVWPIAQKLNERRYLCEGKFSLSRPYIRPVRVARTERVRVDVGLFLPNDPNTFAFTEEQIVRLAEMEYAVFWPGVPVAWKVFTIAKLQAGLTAVLDVFPSYRLECRSGPQGRIDLKVPFERNGEAKFYFARWDPLGATWYVPEFLWNEGLEQFAMKYGPAIVPTCRSSEAHLSNPPKH